MTCNYYFVKGAKKGQQCTTKTKNTYCSKHKLKNVVVVEEVVVVVEEDVVVVEEDIVVVEEVVVVSDHNCLQSRAFHFDLDDLIRLVLGYDLITAPRPPPVSQTRLSEIPQITITREQTESNIQCSVCFDEFRLAESGVRKLPCNHLFHEKCIFPWLRINGSCPVCRASS